MDSWGYRLPFDQIMFFYLASLARVNGELGHDAMLERFFFLSWILGPGVPWFSDNVSIGGVRGD
jgi:hypothetical protein